MKRNFVPVLLCFITAAIWGFAFVAQVQGTAYIEPFTLTGVRFLIGIIALAPVVLIFEKGRVSKEERKKTVVASLVTGAILFIASSLQQFGIQITASAGIAGFITGLYTVLVPIACFLFFKKRTGINVWLGAAFALVGLFLLCYKPGEGFRFGMGELLLLIGALFWTAHVVTIDRLGKNIRSLHFAWGQFAVCAVLGIALMFVFEEPKMTDIMSAKWSLLYCGVLSSGVAYTLQVVAQKRSDPTVAAIIFSTESMFSAIGGVIFKIDRIALLGYFGCAMIFVGIIVSQIEFKRRKNKLPLE